MKNPFTDRSTRADYYQLVRKWKVDLYRYGLRLTYDIIIPEPGSDLMQKIIDIQDVKDDLEKGFIFELKPSDITRATYAEKGQRLMVQR